MASAEDEALLRIARERGRLPPGAGAVPSGLRAGLLAELRRWVFDCARGCVRVAGGDLAQLPELRCPSCGGELVPRAEAALGSGGVALERTRHDPASRRLAAPDHHMETKAIKVPLGAEPPRQLGGYTLHEELGRGAAGVVYRARRGDLPRDFALKVLLQHGDDPNTLGRFELEAHVAAKLDHPGIVGVIDMGREGEFPFCVMELCRGPNLKQRLRDGPLRPTEAATLVRDLARAIDHAHAQGVLHRDLKPANVILDERSGRPRITDFGLARDRSMRQSLTQSGDAIGTPLYMSPEQCAATRDLDRRVDVWALGVILFECLTGQRPFVGSSPIAVFHKITSARPPAPRELNPDVPAALERITLAALERDREARTPDAASLADALEAWLEADAAGAGRGRSPWVAIGGAVAVGAVALALAAAAALGDPAPEASPSVAVAPPEPLPVGTDPAPAPTPTQEPSPTATEDPPPRPAPQSDDDLQLSRLADAMTFPSHRKPRPPALVAAWKDIPVRAPALTQRYPRDARAMFLRVYRRLLANAGDELPARRELLAAARGRPPLSDKVLGLMIHLHHTLGFQRAACDLLEPRVAGGRVPDAFLGLAMLHVTMKSAPPVKDLPRTVELTRRQLRARLKTTPGPGDRLLVPTWDLHANLAEALIAVGKPRPAAEAFRQAAAVQPEARFADYLREQATKADAGERPPETATRNVSFAFGLTRLTRSMAQLQALEERSEERAAREAEGIALRALRERRPNGRVALFLVRAGRSWERAGRPAEALRPLRRAFTLRFRSQDRDVRYLVARVLARLLLAQPEPEPLAAEAARVARAAVDRPPLGDVDLRTRGEWADAWLLIAEAALLAGDRDGARKAVAEARERRPFDRRQLQALSARVR